MIDHGENHVPLYFRIAETLKRRILSGEYELKKTIPSEEKLALEFGASNITIRKALANLVKENLVSRRRGIGTVIKPARDDRLAIKITGDFRDWFDSASGKYPRNLDVNVLEIGVSECPERVRKILSLSHSDKVWRAKRIRSFQGESYGYFVNFGSYKHFRRITRKMLMEKTLFELLRESGGFQICRIDQRVEVVSASLDLSSLLGIGFGAPLFYCENTYYDLNLGAIEVTEMYYRGDRFIYSSSIQL